jgi:hypothetical protein
MAYLVNNDFARTSRRILIGFSPCQKGYYPDRKAITIDSSYISKSGKCSPWIGYFWSGIKPNRRLNDKLIKEIVDFESIAA